MPWHNIERARYDHEYRRFNSESTKDGYLPMKGGELWSHLVKIMLKEKNRHNHVMLDVGCGPGFSMHIAKHFGLKLYGIDIASEAAWLWKDNGVEDRAVAAFADSIPFKDNTFDFITCLDVMEHIPEEGVIPSFLEMRRVLKESGALKLCIGLYPAEIKMSDGSEPHVCIKPHGWWIEQIKEANLKIAHPPRVSRLLPPDPNAQLDATQLDVTVRG